MAKDKQKQKSRPVQENQGNDCPKKEGDNCLVPGVFSDSKEIGGG